MSDVVLTPSGPPDTILEPEPAAAEAALSEALAAPSGQRREAVASVVGRWPAMLGGWATLGDLARDPVEAYACYRVGYHRGLDRLRQSGWRGSGYVRWQHPTNHGFLRALAGLGRAAEVIGEHAEHERCAQFLLQLDPSGEASRRGVPSGAAWG